MTSEGNYSIISDYLGTPVESYDEQGNKVWSAELDIYGRVKEFTGEKDFIPFRYQGQYADEEIRFYYNRYRYYSPQAGMYTQPDPIVPDPSPAKGKGGVNDSTSKISEIQYLFRR
ncbi:RHS repeat domain-containing protein [Lysinibacillus xylanilyticus]|uniref:RHS repeat domain-containing protein n=1 Tax=Lysinibacillus xylanilyticus TaxID=582475 RepID=UPI0009F70848